MAKNLLSLAREYLQKGKMLKSLSAVEDYIEIFYSDDFFLYDELLRIVKQEKAEAESYIKYGTKNKDLAKEIEQRIANRIFEFIQKLEQKAFVGLVTAPPLDHASRLFDQLAKSFSELLNGGKGKIVFESPVRMRLNHSEYVTVRISHKSLKNAILKEGLDASKTKEGELEISDVMEVALFELEGQHNFDIFPLNHGEQLLNKESYTEWQFSLGARRVGTFSLILRVSMKVHHPDFGEKRKDIVTWSTAIEVDVDSEAIREKIQVKRLKWVNNFKKNLKKQIANNDFSSVFQDLANHLSTRDMELFNDLVLLQARFNSLGNAHRSGVLSHEEYTMNFSRIAGSLIMLIDEVGSPRRYDAMGIYKSEVRKMKEAGTLKN